MKFTTMTVEVTIMHQDDRTNEQVESREQKALNSLKRGPYIWTAKRVDQ